MSNDNLEKIYELADPRPDGHKDCKASDANVPKVDIRLRPMTTPTETSDSKDM